MAKKSLFNTFLSLFTPSASSLKHNISASKALSLQNEYITANSDNERQSYPPYKEILKQLTSNKPEIFQAALYYLGKIARNEPDYTAAIADDIQNFLKHNKLSAADRQAIANLLPTTIPDKKQ